MKRILPILVLAIFSHSVVAQDSKNIKFGVGATVEQSFESFTQINSTIVSYGAPKVAWSVMRDNFSLWSLHNRSKYSISFEHSPQTTTNNDLYSVAYSALGFMLSYGYDLLETSRHSLLPTIGAGYRSSAIEGVAQTKYTSQTIFLKLGMEYYWWVDLGDTIRLGLGATAGGASNFMITRWDKNTAYEQPMAGYFGLGVKFGVR